MPRTIKDLLELAVPLPVVALLVLNSMAFVWWGSAQVNSLSTRIAALEFGAIQTDKYIQSRNSHEGRIIVLEQVSSQITRDLAEIKAILRGGTGGGR